MNINGISYLDFFKATKSAYELISGSPIKHDSIIRKFLNNQLFPNQCLGENEHRLKDLFLENISKSENDNSSMPNQCIVITFNTYDTSEENPTLESHDNFICLNSEAVNKKLRNLFLNNFPDNDGISDTVLSHSLVEDKISDLCDDDIDEIEKLNEQLRSLYSDDICQWLLDNFEIDDLISDDFFCEYLWMNQYSISYETSDVFF